MDEPNVRAATSEDLPAVSALWRNLQEYHLSLGLAFPLETDASDKWISSFQRTLGRFSFLWVGHDRDQVSAFLLARIKQSPAYLGGFQIGEISDLFVADNLRGSGIGTRLAETAIIKLQEVGVHSIEVQIQAGNDGGLAFWQKLDFKTDLTMVRKVINLNASS
jgi:L-amino acid N-acyltransferase YncA